MTPITAADGAPLYTYCLYLDDYDFFAENPATSPHVLTFALYKHEDDLYDPTDNDILPAVFEAVKEALQAFPEALAAARAAADKLRAEFRGWALVIPPPKPAT